jgi:ABC-type polysaccharide/polyol phosphate transport system ATPase subunit
MQAITQLTKRCVLLSKGELQFDGKTNKAVQLYLAEPKASNDELAITKLL